MNEERYYKEFWKLHDEIGGVSDPVPYQEYLEEEVERLTAQNKVLLRSVKNAKETIQSLEAVLMLPVAEPKKSNEA